MMCSVFSSYVIVCAENQFWSFAIDGVEFLKELVGLPAELVTEAINKGIDLGNKYNEAMKDGVDYGGATYNKTENKFYLKKDVNNNVYINQNLYNVVHSVASDVISKCDGYYIVTPSHSFDELIYLDVDKNYFLNNSTSESPDSLAYVKSDLFKRDYAEWVRQFHFAIYPLKKSKDEVGYFRPIFFSDNISGFDSDFYLVSNGGSAIYAYTPSDGFSSRYNVSHKICKTSYVSPGVYGLSFDSYSSYTSILNDVFTYSAGNFYGSPFRVFYSLQDLKNFFYGTHRLIPKITINNTLKIPSDLFDNGKLSQQITNIYNNIDKSNKNENEIQDSFNTEVNNYFNDFSDGNDNPVTPTPTPPTGGSGGGDGGNITPTPAPDFTDGLKDTNDYLKQILEKVTSILQIDTEFSKSFETVSQNLCKYLESNNEKLDQIITAINALSNGKTEDEVNGCKYDFTQLSQSLTSLWNDSDQKFDQMIKLLEENNKYQEKIIGDLNDIKAILIAQTVLDAFQNRSKETADKAKEKFPTSIPWDIALIVNTFSAEPEPLKFELPIKVNSLNINETITVDLSTGEWEKLGKLCRYMLSVLFILFLIQLSRKLFSNGGDE